MTDYRVMHILPDARRRGAQMRGSELFSALKDRGIDGSLVILFDGEDQIGIAGGPGVVFLKKRPGIGAVLALSVEIARYKPDVIVAHGGQPLKYALFARGRRSRPPVIYQKIGLTERWMRWPRRLRALIYSMLFKRADRVISIGKAAKAELTDIFGVPSEKIDVVYRGFDTSRFSVPEDSRGRIRAELGIPEDAPLLMTIGNLSWEKNQAVAVKVLKRLKIDMPDAMLAVVGGGPEEGVIRAAARELLLERDVVMTGPRSDVPDLLRAADVVVLTSLIEGVPGVLVEAGLSGLPSAAWDVAGVREVLEDGVTGYVTPFGDVERLADAVKIILSDPVMAERMGRAAQAHCAERFDMDNCVGRYSEVFEDVLRGTRAHD